MTRDDRRDDEREPSLDELLRAIEPDAAARERLRAAHVELERRLGRLEVPEPPPELVARVLERVAHASEEPRLSRADRLVGLVVGVVAAGAAAGTAITSGPTGLLVDLVSALSDVRQGAAALLGATRALWATAPTALAAAGLLALLPSLVGLRRLASDPRPQRGLP